MDLSGNKKGNAKKAGRRRMAKTTDKYYDLYIKTNVARREELDALYQLYKKEKEEANEKVQTKMNWRKGTLSDWLGKESAEVKADIERSRREEMAEGVVQNPEAGDNDEEKRLKRARKIER